MKDLIDSSIDVAVATYTGDIEIAEDQLKASAWLIALATAALYFCFQEIEKSASIPASEWQRIVVYGYSFAGFLLILSFMAAYKFRKAHAQMAAYSRNILCAYKMLRADLIANLDKVEAFRKKADKSVPFWKHIYSGEIYSIINQNMTPVIPNLDAKVVHWRERVESIANRQRSATLFGFLLLASLKLMVSVLSAAI